MMRKFSALGQTGLVVFIALVAFGGNAEVFDIKQMNDNKHDKQGWKNAHMQAINPCQHGGGKGKVFLKYGTQRAE